MNIKLFIWVILLLSGVAGFCVQPIIFSKDVNGCLFKGSYIDTYEDKYSGYTIYDILKPQIQTKFVTGKPEVVESNLDKKSSYWLKLSIINNDENLNNVASELFDFRINYYEVYVVKKGNIIFSSKGGADFPFTFKKYLHKNFIHNIPINYGDRVDLYYKIRSSHPVNFIGMIRTYDKLLSYSNTEYFMLALFYGAILSLAFYNFFIFLAVRDKAYLYYVFYVLSVGLYSLSQDGLGFQYIWFDVPAVNIYIFQCSGFLVIFWILFYSKRFLNTHIVAPRINTTIIVLIFLRSILLLYTIYNKNFNPRWVDLSLLLFIYSCGIFLWFKGKREARFFVTGFSIFFIGYLITFLLIFNLIVATAVVIYSFNIGVIFEMLLFSFALADRIKIITEDNSRTQKQLLIQAKDNEFFIQNANKELENKVLERTRLLDEKNKELDTFVYRSSHDIKGPIKSIIGLSNLALLEVQDHPVAREYFERMLECSKKLDNVNSNLLSLIDFKNLEIKPESISFNEIFENILDPIRKNTKYNFISKKLVINQTEDFNTDLVILKIICKDIIDNAVLFANQDHEISILKINVEVKSNVAKLHLYATGNGIPQNIIDDIFNPFSTLMYKAENNQLGLYLLKMHTERINGKFNFSSTLGKEAYFDLEFPNLSIDPK